MAYKKSSADKNNKKKDKPKVIQFNANPAIELLEKLLEEAKAGNIDNFIFAGFTDDDKIVYSRINLNIIEQQHLVSYLQCDTTIRTVNEGLVKDIDELYDDDDDEDDDE